MSNILDHKKASIRLGSETVDLDYSMASIHYLAGKYGDLTKLFDRKDNAIDAEFISRLADVVYAGLLRYDDDDGKDVSGWNPTKVMTRLHLNQINEIAQAFSDGMSLSMPEDDAGPTTTPETKEEATTKE